MSCDQIIRDLKDKTCHQKEQILKLREKLVTYDKVITKKEELQCQLHDVKRWMEDIEFKEKQIITDLLNNLECQTKKLKKSEAVVCQLQTERNKLLELNNCMAEQLSTLKQNEQKLLNSIEELKQRKKRLQCELSNANSKMEEQNCCIEKLTQAIRCKEEECCEMRRQLDECMIAFGRLTDACRSQEKELECMKRELVELKNDACQMEEKLKCEREILSNKLEITCQRFREMEIEYEEVRQNLCEEKSNVCKLEKQMEEIQQVNEKERCEANAKIQTLKKENCVKDENACQMKSHIADLIRENECKCSEITTLKSKVQANDCLLEKIKHSSEVFDQMKNNKVDQLEREKYAMECDLKQKKKIIGEMKREACRLKNAIKIRDQCNNCPSEREVCCVRDKIKKIESMSIPSSCFSVSKCEFSSTRGKKCSFCSVSPRESSYSGCSRGKKCNMSSCCSFNCTTKCSTGTKTCNIDGENRVLSELKQLYCDIEKLKDTTKSSLARC